jgi:hypothetical protein
MCQHTIQRPEEFITAEFIDGFIINNFRCYSAPNEILDLATEKVFPNSTCPIMVKKMSDIQQVMEFNDSDLQDLSTSNMEDNQQSGPGKVKYWA